MMKDAGARLTEVTSGLAYHGFQHDHKPAILFSES
jgi:hypothetical protein